MAETDHEQCSLSDIPTDELRAWVKRKDAALRRVLRSDGPLSAEIEDLRSVVAARRVELRRREAAEALDALREGA